MQRGETGTKQKKLLKQACYLFQELFLFVTLAAVCGTAPNVF